MNKKVKNKWVRALTSGEYVQYKNHLANSSNTKFCCLGVLTDIYCKEKRIEGEDRAEFLDGNYLPMEVMKWSGIKREDGFIPENKRKKVDPEFLELGHTLAEMNDKGLEFKDIAKVIKVAF